MYISWLYKPPGVIVYGHTSKAEEEYTDDMLKTNPGSHTFAGYHISAGTVDLLESNNDEVEVEIKQPDRNGL